MRRRKEDIEHEDQEAVGAEVYDEEEEEEEEGVVSTALKKMCDKDVREALTTVFKECDKDKSGAIDAKEAEAALRKCFNAPGCKEKWDDAKIKAETTKFFAQADKDKDHKVSLKEFVDYYAPLIK